MEWVRSGSDKMTRVTFQVTGGPCRGRRGRKNSEWQPGPSAGEVGQLLRPRPGPKPQAAPDSSPGARSPRVLIRTGHHRCPLQR